jgi:hypothetical protein
MGLTYPATTKGGQPGVNLHHPTLAAIARDTWSVDRKGCAIAVGSIWLSSAAAAARSPVRRACPMMPATSSKAHRTLGS